MIRFELLDDFQLVGSFFRLINKNWVLAIYITLLVSLSSFTDVESTMHKLLTSV